MDWTLNHPPSLEQVLASRRQGVRTLFGSDSACDSVGFDSVSEPVSVSLFWQVEGLLVVLVVLLLGVGVVLVVVVVVFLVEMSREAMQRLQQTLSAHCQQLGTVNHTFQS